MQNTAPALQETPLNLLADWISREQLAGELGLACDTLARWEARQLGPPCTRIGRKVGFAWALVRSVDDALGALADHGFTSRVMLPPRRIAP